MIDIKKGEKSFYVGDNEEDPLAMMGMVNNEDEIIIDHTFVSEKLRGQNVGRQLLDKIVNYAREKNKTINATCTYAKAELNKNKDYKDVINNQG